MTIKDIPNFAPESKVWIYQSDRELSVGEAVEIESLINQFTKQWTAHSHALNAWGGVLYNRFILLMVDESMASASGCSIDSSVHFLKKLESEYSLNLFNRLRIAYWKGSEIKTVHRSELQDKIKNGELSLDTLVFNNMVTNKRDLKEKWQVKLEDSWAGSLISV